VAAVATVVVLSAGLGGAAEAGAGAAEEGVALASRGIVRDVVGETAGEIEAGYDGVFMATTNEAGGTVWTSLGPVTQADFASLVEGAVLEGSEVNIITGAHGLANGTTQAALQFYEADVAAFGAMPGVNVLNINAMSASAIAEVAAAPATTIGALCYSAACLAPLL
jgi:hypothetical protein